MNKVRKTLVVVFSALFVLCMALFAVGCGDTNSSKTPDETKSAYSVSVDVNDPSLGKYTLTAANSGDAYVEGTAVTVTVEPNEDYDASLIVNGEEVALTDNSYTFAVQSDTDLQVNYSYKYVAYTSVTAGKGTVTLSEPKNGSVYEKGEEVTVTVEAAEHYELKSLRINNDYVNLTDGEVKFQITGKTYIFAEFVALHTVTVENEEAKGAVVLRANGKAVESGVVLAEGTEVELAVTPLNGNTVKAVYVAGAWTPLDEAGKATFTLQKDSVVEVVYNTYYTVTLPKEAKGGSVTLSEKAAALGYLEGTVLTLTVTPAEGYVVTSFKVTVGGEAVDGAKLNFKKYTFTVTADVTVEVEFEAKEDALTYNVNIALSNSGYGAAELSEDANDDGTYSYGTDLLLEVTPNDGYKVSYVTVNGNRTEAQEDGKYAITVTEDIDIFVCFEKAARFTVRVEMYGLTGATATLQIDGNTLEADDGNEYIKTEVYEGQTASVAVTMGTLEDGMQLYYYLNGGARVLYVDGNIDIGKVTENVTVRLAAEAPTKPTYTYKTVVGNDEAQPDKPDYSGVVKECKLEKGKYTITLNAPAELKGYVFDSWTVELDGKALTADATTGAYTFDYNDEGMALTLTATWNKTIDVTLPEATEDSLGAVSIVEAKPYLKDAPLTIKVEPIEGYRVKTITVTVGGTELNPQSYNASGEQTYEVKADDNLSVTVEYQAIFTYEYVAPAHASFTITATEGTFLEVNADKTVYTLDVDGTYTVNFTPDEGYQFTSVKVGEQSAVAGEKGAYTYTGALNSETEIKAVAAKTVIVTYTVEPNQPKYNEKVVVRYDDEDGEVIPSGTKLAAGTKVRIYIAGYEGCVGTITGIGNVLGSGLSFGKITVGATGVYNLSYVLPEDGLNITVTYELIAPTLSQNFPTKEQAAAGAKEYPTQGEWKSNEAQDKAVLIVKENTMYVNGDPVTEFGYDLSDPSKFALTTENAAGEKNTYTLEWFGGEQGFILELTDTTPPTPAPTPAGRRYAANDAAEPAESKVVYLVNPIYGASWYMEYLGTDKDTLVGEDNKWVHTEGTGEEAVETTIEFSEVDGKAHVSFNGTAASYVFAVEEGHYLFVVGTTAYNMTIGDSFITVNGDQYLLPSTYAVTVTETPAETGCSYTLKNGDVAVTSGSAVTKDTKLTLTITLADHYTAAVTVNGQPATAKEGSANVYEITVTAATTIAITYTLKQYSVTVTEVGKPETVSEAWYELKNGTTAVTSGNKVDAKSQLTLTLKAPVTYTVAVVVTGGTETHEGNTYTITVTADTTITITYTMIQYTVTVTESGKPETVSEAWYELKNGTTAVASGNKVDTGTELKLTLTLPQGYTATVKVGENALTAGADGSYTITVTADTIITITYTPPVVTDVVITAMTNNSISATGEGKIEIPFYVAAENGGITNDILKAAQVIIGTYTQAVDARTGEANKDGTGGIIYVVLDPANIPDGTTPVQIKIGNTTYPLKITAGYSQDKSLTIGDKLYAFDLDADTPTVTVSAAPTEYTVAVTEEGKPTDQSGAWYNLTGVTDGKAAANAQITLTFTLPDGYMATVKVNDQPVQAQENGTYTITVNTNITIAITYVEVGEFTGTRTLQSSKESYTKEDFYADDHFKLVLVEADFNWLEDLNKKGILKHVLINEETEPCPLAGKGFNFDGTAIQIQVKGFTKANLPEQIVLHWYNISDQEVATVTVKFSTSGSVTPQPPAAEKGALVEEASNKAIVNSGKNDEAKQEDGFMLWWVQGNWGDECGALVELSDMAYSEGKVSFKYHGGDRAHSVQLFYFNTHLGAQEYFLTLNIKSSIAITVIVNGKSVSLNANAVTPVEVLFTNSTVVNQGVYAVDIQFPGTTASTSEAFPNNAIDMGGGTDIAIEVSEVKWYFVKGQEPQPTLTFDKGDGTGENPTVTFGEANEAGMFTVTLPENTFTAPANKYFRGWEYNEVVYFPGEQFDIKAGATATLKAVWEELAVERQGAVSLLEWFNGDTTTLTLYDGKSLELVAKISDSTPVEWHGIIPDINMNVNGTNYWLHFRVDGYTWTATDGVNSNDTEDLQNLITNNNWNKDAYLNLIRGKDALAVITASLANNVLTYTYSNYEVSDTSHSQAITSITWQVTSSTSITSLDIKFLYQGETGFAVKEATLKSTLILSENQNPTASNPIKVGAEDMSTTYNDSQWRSIIKQGEKFVFTGTQSTNSTATANDSATGVGFAYSTNAEVFFRADAWVNGTAQNSGIHTDDALQWSITKNNTWEGITQDNWDELKAFFKTGVNFVITIDWTNAKEIHINYVFSGTGENASKKYTMNYVVTSTAANGDFLSEEYYVTLGCNMSYAAITSLVRTGAASTEA